MTEKHKNRFFILVQTNSTDWALRAWRDNGIMAEIVYRPVNKLLRAIRRVWVRCRLPFQSVWYNDWKNQVKKAEIVIVHISSLTMDVAAYINKLNPDCKVIAWYWNVVRKNTAPNKIKGDAELWSFDPEDCRKYNMHFNHQYYFSSLVMKSDTIENDVYYCGSDAGRGEKLVKIYNELKELGLKVKFRIVDPHYPGIPESIKSSYVSYEDIRADIAKSNAVVEIIRNGQSGATLRTMEALFFGKKLITNNIKVADEDFYDMDTILIYDDQHSVELSDFINSGNPIIDCHRYEQYDFDHWLKRFVIENE